MQTPRCARCVGYLGRAGFQAMGDFPLALSSAIFHTYRSISKTTTAFSRIKPGCAATAIAFAIAPSLPLCFNAPSASAADAPKRQPVLRVKHPIFFALALAGCGFTAFAHIPADKTVLTQALQQKAVFLITLRELCDIESGSRDVEGLDQITALLTKQFKALGGTLKVIDHGEVPLLLNGKPERVGKTVLATFTGSGTKKILLLAHMDTVYPRGSLAKQPFRIDGDRAYGLGVADDKQGIAVILHTLAILKSIKFYDYGTITVLIDGAEELGAPGARTLISELGKTHDVTLSFESSRVQLDKISLATAGIAALSLNVTGKAAHAGVAPEQGVNALDELAYQILHMRDLSEPARGIKLNWTLAQAGTARNVIPAYAQAQADVRVLKVADYARIENQARERIRKKLIPETKVELVFERRMPPLEASDASLTLARHAQLIYRELGKDLVVDTQAEGAGTDAAYAGLATKNAVIERLGLQGYGMHSTNSEYVLIDSIAPRLYLTTRLIMDIAQNKTF